ncbi:hypothetical protein H0H93_005506 [Arthromyces matolae]|nr:hypothetical protein H0H93_005506 [Arthromyces matolae]
MAEVTAIADDGELSFTEVFWRDHYEHLRKHGYTLRRRYEPDWSPSWVTNGTSSFGCEDATVASNALINDASRRDGSSVMLKRMDTTDPSTKTELAMARFVSSPDLSITPRNRCVPILEFIPPKEGSNTAFMVMPLLFDVHITPFETIGEVVEYFRQLFEGLQFMHNHNFVHGDCKWNNIMADSGPLYDHLLHPVNYYMRRDYRGFAPNPVSRTIRPIKYYFIDFDLSTVFGPDDVRLRIPPWGGDRTVPEHQLPHDPPCDPFPGVALMEVKPKEGFEFMRELVSDMVKDNPRERPTMDQVVARYDNMINGLSEWKLRSPVVTVGESLGIFGFIGHWVKHFVYHLRGIPAIPRA